MNLHSIKDFIRRELNKTIGNYSSVNETPHNDSNVEYYIREGGKNKTMTDTTSTEPDPKGDIAVTKSVDSDLARRKITKAISRLEKALTSLPDTGRASSVSVSNETAPVAKADGTPVVNLDGAAQQVSKAMKSLKKAISSLPDTGRASSVSVSNETAPVAKATGDMQGTDGKVEGEGDYSEKANTTVSQDAEPMTKMDAEDLEKADNKCADCGDTIPADATKCSKCLSKSDEATDLEKADDDSDAGSEPDNDADDSSIKKSEEPSEIQKGIWGGAFGTAKRPTIA